MSKGDGGKLREYLKDNKVNQQDLATSLGLTRQGLIYHLDKEMLDHEFKMKLRSVGIMLFDENGKLNLSFETSEKTSLDLHQKYVLVLEEQVELQKEMISSLRVQLKACLESK